MKKDEDNRTKSIILMIILILVSSVVAILSKNLLPSEVNESDFNSIFIKVLGLPVVGSLYFIMIYSHNAIVTRIFARQTEMADLKVGLRFGACFALIYLFGMQEVVVESSPFCEWGLPFVFYQFVMGIGEAVAAFLLCLSVAKYATYKKNNETKPPVIHNSVLLVLFITVAFTLERSISSEFGIISSNVRTFPVPHYLWTVVFGFVLGICFVLIAPVFFNENSPVVISLKAGVLTIGLSWILFNLFIGLIFDDALFDVLLRSGLDVTAIFIASDWWFKASKVKSMS